MAITLVKDEKPARPFCRDCRWHVQFDIGEATYHRCHAPQNARPSAMELVTGVPSNSSWFCETASVQRSAFDVPGYCGPEGRWFEPRTSEPTSHPSEEVAA